MHPTETIRLFLWTHPWWHAAAVLIPPVLVAAFFSWRELSHSAKANRLRQESKAAVARIAELQNERNELERQRNSLMEKIAENTKRPLNQAERNALKLRKYIRKTAQVSEGNGHWDAMGAEIVDVSEDNVLTLFVPAEYSSSVAFAVYVHCDELQIVEEPVGSCALQIKILKRYGNTLQLGEIRKWDDRRTPPTKPLPRGGRCKVPHASGLIVDTLYSFHLERFHFAYFRIECESTLKTKGRHGFDLHDVFIPIAVYYGKAHSVFIRHCGVFALSKEVREADLRLELKYNKKDILRNFRCLRDVEVSEVFDNIYFMSVFICVAEHHGWQIFDERVGVLLANTFQVEAFDFVGLYKDSKILAFRQIGDDQRVCKTRQFAK